MDAIKTTSFDEKLAHLYTQLSEFGVTEIEAFPSELTGYRMRAEFRVWHDGDELYHVMFHPQDKKKYRVDHLPAACTMINRAMSAVLDRIKGNTVLRKKLFQIEYLSSLSEELVVSLIYHKHLDDDWVEQARHLKNALSAMFNIDIIGRARKQKLVIDRDFLIEKLPIRDKTYLFKHVEGSFTQPNARINCDMIEWVQGVVGKTKHDVLELYCGAGNFTIPLGHAARKVFGTEISRTSVQAAQENIAFNQANNVVIARISSEAFSEAMVQGAQSAFFQEYALGTYQFDTVLVDPPRAGLDDDTIKMITQFDNIVYVSCNPTSLVENLRRLSMTHRVCSAAFFDQFPLTPHIETGIYMTRLR